MKEQKCEKDKFN